MERKLESARAIFTLMKYLDFCTVILEEKPMDFNEMELDNIKRKCALISCKAEEILARRNR